MRLSSSACQAANLPPELRGAALAYWVRESEFPLLEPNKKTSIASDSGFSRKQMAAEAGLYFHDERDAR
jgi:hypothetical protein